MSSRNSKPYVVGITGTIGSGKSTVGAILEKHGVPVIDSDKVVHDLFATSNELRNAISSRFGEKVLTADGNIDRAALGQIVFSDPTARQDLNAIVHPATIAACRKNIDEHADSEIVAILVPLLYEAGLEEQYNEVWTVHANEQTLRKRLQARDKFTQEEVDKRLAAQLSQQEKMSRATHTIDNSNTPSETEDQAVTLLNSLRHQLRKRH